MGAEHKGTGGRSKLGGMKKGKSLEPFLQRPDLYVPIPTSLDVGEKDN